MPNVAIQGNAEAIQVIATMMEDLLTRAPASGDSWRAGNEEAGKVAVWIGFLISTFHLAKPREIDHPVFIPPSVWHSLIGVLPQESYCLIGETNKELVQRLNRLNAEINAIRRRNGDLDQAAYDALEKEADAGQLITDAKDLVQQLHIAASRQPPASPVTP